MSILDKKLVEVAKLTIFFQNPLQRYEYILLKLVSMSKKMQKNKKIT